jgi:glutamate synthase (NADPH/NADH) small chain
VEFILSIGGITLQTGKTLGIDFSLAQLRQEFDAVFLGLGHNDCNHLDLDHENAEGMHNAVDYIRRIRQEDLSTLPVGRRVVVIGGGNTAIDIAVQIHQLGAELVTLVYRRGPTDMSATDYEQEIAQTHGVLIRNWATPYRINTDDTGMYSITFEQTHIDERGRLAGTGEYFELEADQVFKAIGQHFDEALLTHHEGGDEFPAIDNGRIRIDQERRTSLGGVWAGGDCVPGQDLTVAAVQDGKLAALSIHQFLGGNSHG